MPTKNVQKTAVLASVQYFSIKPIKTHNQVF